MLDGLPGRLLVVSLKWPAAGKKQRAWLQGLAGNGSGAQGRPASIFNEGGNSLFPCRSHILAIC